MSKDIYELRERMEQNYEDFKAEIFEMHDKEEIFGMARQIAAVEDVYHFATTQGSWVEEGEAAYLLAFCDPLKMLADAWEAYIDENEQDFRMVVEEVLDRDDNTESYVTMALAENLRKKHGADTNYKDALLAEAISTGKRYLRLKSLLEEEGVGLCIERE